jgi:hypothetical protein
MFQLLISIIENNCMGAMDLTIALDLNPLRAMLKEH